VGGSLNGANLMAQRSSGPARRSWLSSSRQGDKAEWPHLFGEIGKGKRPGISGLGGQKRCLRNFLETGEGARGSQLGQGEEGEESPEMPTNGKSPRR